MRPIAPRSVFGIFFALIFVVLACWSFADPLVAAPDEQAHIIRAYAIDHGQLGSPSTLGKAETEVTVPESINFTKIYPQCWQFKGGQSADCAPAWTTSQAPIETNTYVGHYPPLYYVLAGSGSWVARGRDAVYAMRLASSLVSALMLALGAYAIARWSKRRTLAAGYLVAMTPLVYFLGSSVNPSGFEISTAICLWTALVIFALDYPKNPPRGLVALIGVAASVLTLIRGLSPLWTVLIALVIVVVTGVRPLLDLLRRRRDVQIAVGATTVAGLLAVGWIVTQDTLSVQPSLEQIPKGDSELQTVRLVLDQVPRFVSESVGVLGWLDTVLPGIVYHAWYAMVAVIVVAALWRAAWRGRAALVAICALALLVPVAIAAKQAHVDGIVWQGRDSMPLTVGIVILGAALLGRPGRASAVERWGAMAVVAIVTVLDMLSFYTNLRRYAVGRHGPHLFFIHNVGWSPPTGQFLTLAVFAVAQALIGLAVLAWIDSARSPLESPH